MNGTACEHALLRNGDRIQLGKTELQFVDRRSNQQQPSPAEGNTEMS